MPTMTSSSTTRMTTGATPIVQLTRAGRHSFPMHVYSFIRLSRARGVGEDWLRRAAARP